jgi:hypothetical protein
VSTLSGKPIGDRGSSFAFIRSSRGPDRDQQGFLLASLKNRGPGFFKPFFLFFRAVFKSRQLIRYAHAGKPSSSS